MVAAASAVSARRIRANRLNSRKSTGPKTPEGKARSSRNAIGHGIFCNDTVLPGENRALFDALRTALVHEHRPQTVTELFFVDRLASSMWRLRRLGSAEAAAHEAMSEEMIQQARKVHEELEEEMEDSLDDLDDEADEQESDSLAGDSLPHPLPAAVTTHGLMTPKEGRLSTLERFSLYEKRLEGTAHRCIRDLRKLRTSIKGETVPDKPSPFMNTPAQPLNGEEVAGETSEIKNEANEEMPPDRPITLTRPAQTGILSVEARPATDGRPHGRDNMPPKHSKLLP